MVRTYKGLVILRTTYIEAPHSSLSNFYSVVREEPGTFPFPARRGILAMMRASLRHLGHGMSKNVLRAVVQEQHLRFAIEQCDESVRSLASEHREL
jgi:hypothetical protein